MKRGSIYGNKKNMKAEEFDTDDDLFRVIDRNLEETLDIETVRYLDEHICELFKRVFYSYTHDVDSRGVERPGILTQFLRHWKDAAGVSSIPKQFPTVLSGMKAYLPFLNTFSSTIL